MWQLLACSQNEQTSNNTTFKVNLNENGRVTSDQCDVLCQDLRNLVAVLRTVENAA
jgi:archaellum component FlaF (FlaF/FlaG flagellin family)